MTKKHRDLRKSFRIYNYNLKRIKPFTAADMTYSQANTYSSIPIYKKDRNGIYFLDHYDYFIDDKKISKEEYIHFMRSLKPINL